MGVDYGAKLVYGYKLKNEDIKPALEIPRGVQAKTGYDYPSPRDCFEQLWNEYREQDFIHFNTDAIGGNGVLVVGVSIARARSSNAVKIKPETGIEAADKLTDELDNEISKIAYTEDREPRLILASTIG